MPDANPSTVRPDAFAEPALRASTAAMPLQRREPTWVRRYASRLIYTDALIMGLTLAGFGVFVLPNVNTTLSWPGGPNLPYVVPLSVVGVLWLLCLDAFDTRDRHIVGHGVVEYRRIINATFFVFATIVIIAFFLRIEVARALFLVALPVGLAGLLAGRWGWRQWLRQRQKAGAFVYRAVVLGDGAKLEHIITQIRGTHGTGYVIIGAITPRGTPIGISDVPVLGALADAEHAIDDSGADTLIVGGADELDPATMRRLGWAMADRDVNWVVAPALTDIAGPRIHARPVAGLPLVHVDFPQLEGYRRVVKRTFDIVASTILLVLASPIMLGTAIAVRVEGPGSVFYTQQRVGRRGTTFAMIKFRSMIQGADDQLASLLDLQGTTDRPFFKVTDDARITRVGRFIRRHSIDELPQLLNVFAGQMSLIGPRPQRPAEVALYDEVHERRLLVKPGMSGLWQVSGRSKLSWEDSIRLDLYYVENWSFTQDIQILFRTVKAVIAPGETAH
ncbi:sugar transferase [Microbacterium sulfonylureivorans]|uniref:sugar transferase n=1 Tax=Microbacterium sulfonylureivorans TaxID=2486854 RepID=UPI001F0C838E|nr:sugar transferase [Microbacterium sulfonylureivorans]